jgi:hypothetical protein
VGDVLHPAREPLESLEQTRRGMGSLDFSAQYWPAPNDGSTRNVSLAEVLALRSARWAG